MVTPEYDELNTRVSILENTVFGAPPYDPATVKGIFELDADGMTAYLTASGRSVEADGFWSLENVLLAMANATAVQIGHGTYVLNIVSGAIGVQGFELGIGDQVAITTDENFSPVSATYNDQSSLAIAAGKVADLELKTALLETKTALIEARATEQAAQIAAFEVNVAEAGTAGWPRIWVTTVSTEAKQTNAIYVIQPPAWNRGAINISLNYEGASLGFWNRGTVDVTLFFVNNDTSRFFPILKVGQTAVFKFTGGKWAAT